MSTRLDDIEARLAALEARPAAISYEGVWDVARRYDVGMFVTWGGSVWACREPCRGRRPGADGAWQLAVKRGKNGTAAREEGDSEA